MRFSFNKPVKAIIEASGVNENTLAFAVSEARKLMHEFVPMDTGRLAESAQEIIEGGKGSIIYNVPYARFCYYGEALKFSRERNPKAGAFWDRAMMQVYKSGIYERVDKFIKKKQAG